MADKKKKKKKNIGEGELTLLSFSVLPSFHVQFDTKYGVTK